MKQKIKQLVRRESEKDRKSLNSSMDYIIKDEFENPQAIFKRIEKNVDKVNLIKLSRYYVDDFVRTIKTFTIKKHIDNVQAYFHKHDFIELIYVLEGECCQYIGNVNKVIILKKNQAMILNPGTVHAILPSKKKDFIIKMFIPKDYLYTTYDLFTEKDYKNIFNCESCIFTVNVESIRKIDFFLEGLVEDYYSDWRFRNNTLRSYLTLMIIELFKGESIYKDQVNEEIDQKILQYIELEFKCITLKRLAFHFGYCEKYMSRLIKKIFGIGFIKLINSLRIKKGLFYLLSTEMTIEEIAHELGFKNSSNFYRLVNNELGVTPNQIRKEGIIENHENP